MKKLLMTLSLVLVLTGCSSKKTPITSTVENGDTVIATVNGTKITKQDIYEKLIASSGANQVIDHSLQVIANQLVTDESKINEKVQETIDSYIKMLGSEEAFNTYVSNNNYASVDVFKEEMIVPSVKITLLIQQYITDNFSELAKEYGYSYIQTFKVDTESEALDLISKINSGAMSFADAMKEKADMEPGNILCYTNASSATIDSNIASKATLFKEVGLYTSPIKTSDSKYAIVNVVDVDRDAHKDEIITSLLGINIVNSKAQAYYLQENNFTVYEKGIEEDIKSVNSDYLK